MGAHHPPTAAAVSDREDQPLAPRLLDRRGAAAYLSVSLQTIDRLIYTRALHVVRLPVERHARTGLGVPGRTRRVLLDVRELDALIDRSREHE